MSLDSVFLSTIPLQKLKVWVLAPYLKSTDATIDYYYDFSQSIEEYKTSFSQLDIPWKWQPVTMDDYETIIEEIAAEKLAGVHFPVVFNICDGDEINGTPGISVLQLLKKKGLVFTGSDEYFYHITTSKIPMKAAFDEFAVSTPNWEAIKTANDFNENIFEKLGSPIIVKPSVSGGSMGVGIKNVVQDKVELKEQVEKMFTGYRGWNLTSDGLIAESFIAGPEYTVLIVGSHTNPGDAKFFMPVERIFHESLPENEKFLSFDRLWEIYEEETAMPNEANFYEYALPDKSLIEQIQKLSWDAYVACKGTGYARIDIRLDKKNNKLYVLEVNAQCGLSEDENFTSIGAILKASNKTFTSLLVDIINDAFINHTLQTPITLETTI